MHFEPENKDIAPVHEARTDYFEQYILKDTPPQETINSESVTLEINTNAPDSLPEETESIPDVGKSDVAESTDEISVNETTQTVEVNKQKRNKRRIKCKKMKNKQDNVEGKLTGAGDK